MKKKKIMLEDLIPFLEMEKARADSVRTSKLPEVLSSKDVLIKAKKIIQDLIDRWFGYESHVLTTKMMYEAGELKEEDIKEYWPILKDIKIKEEKETKFKMSVPKKRNFESILEEDRALDDRTRGHI